MLNAGIIESAWNSFFKISAAHAERIRVIKDNADGSVFFEIPAGHDDDVLAFEKYLKKEGIDCKFEVSGHSVIAVPLKKPVVVPGVPVRQTFGKKPKSESKPKAILPGVVRKVEVVGSIQDQETRPAIEIVEEPVSETPRETVTTSEITRDASAELKQPEKKQKHQKSKSAAITTEKPKISETTPLFFQRKTTDHPEIKKKSSESTKPKLVSCDDVVATLYSYEKYSGYVFAEVKGKMFGYDVNPSAKTYINLEKHGDGYDVSAAKEHHIKSDNIDGMNFTILQAMKKDLRTTFGHKESLSDVMKNIRSALYQVTAYGISNERDVNNVLALLEESLGSGCCFSGPSKAEQLFCAKWFSILEKTAVINQSFLSSQDQCLSK